MMARFLLIEAGCQGGGWWMGVDDADLISDLLDLRGKGLQKLGELPESALLSSLRRLLRDEDGTAAAFYGFQNAMIDRRIEPPTPS
jgi:FXSXX-COOH protein